MQIAMIGLGRMGANMVRRLLRGGHQVVVFDVNASAVQALASEGATAATSLADVCAKLTGPRHVWLMLPVAFVDQTIKALVPHLSKGDCIIDGGNSYYIDDIAHAKNLAQSGIFFVDCGTSGGVWGLERGYCMMIGGELEAVARMDSAFKTLAPGMGTVDRTPGADKLGTSEMGYLHCGPAGAGHFVKMVHNGIEYGLMQAYGEGLDILKGAAQAHIPAERRYDLDLADITELWRRGSVVSSWLLDLSAISLAEDPELKTYSGYVEDSGEGRWTIQAAIEEAVPADVLSAALYARFRSRKDHTFSEKVLSAMRKQFGGHQEPTKK